MHAYIIIPPYIYVNKLGSTSGWMDPNGEGGIGCSGHMHPNEKAVHIPSRGCIGREQEMRPGWRWPSVDKRERYIRIPRVEQVDGTLSSYPSPLIR